MGKILKLIPIFVFVGMITVSVPNLAGMLGVSHYAARKVVDAIFLGLSFWTILGLIVAGGGVMAIGLGLMKSVVKRLGKKAATVW